MISPATIEAIHELPIENVIDKYVTLKKAGTSLKACCPFHNEKTPSFVVKPQKNTWTCYAGCGHGDAIEFVMRKENMPFIEACERIANDNGIAIERKEGKGKTPEQRQDEQTMLHLLHLAQVKYSNILNERV